MKRVIVLTVVMCLLLCGCSFERTDAKEDDVSDIESLISVFSDAPASGIIEASHRDLFRLSKAMNDVRFRVCGVLVNIDKREYSCSAELVVGEETVHIFLREGQSPIEGEYVEVVGEIMSLDRLRVVLENCTITDRGSAVRERLEAEE